MRIIRILELLHEVLKKSTFAQNGSQDPKRLFNVAGNRVAA